MGKLSNQTKREASKKRKETKRLKQLCSIEEEIQYQGFEVIAGIDEAGRGPLAGPVVAAACILPKGLLIRGINDSKKLNFQKRYELYQELILHPEIHYAAGVVEAVEIDQLNILGATFEAMKRAVARLSKKPEYLLFDGNRAPPFDIPSLAIVDGDRLCQSIAAASIIAKVTRDHIMMGYHDLFPEYGFNEHMGYGTAKHLKAIAEFGLCLIHRKSFEIHLQEKNEGIDP